MTSLVKLAVALSAVFVKTRNAVRRALFPAFVLKSSVHPHRHSICCRWYGPILPAGCRAESKGDQERPEKQEAVGAVGAQGQHQAQAQAQAKCKPHTGARNPMPPAAPPPPSRHGWLGIGGISAPFLLDEPNNTCSSTSRPGLASCTQKSHGPETHYEELNYCVIVLTCASFGARNEDNCISECRSAKPPLSPPLSPPRPE